MCKYCEGTNSDKRKPLNEGESVWIYRIGGIEYLTVDGIADEIKIKFCPMCGEEFDAKLEMCNECCKYSFNLNDEGRCRECESLNKIE